MLTEIYLKNRKEVSPGFEKIVSCTELDPSLRKSLHITRSLIRYITITIIFIAAILDEGFHL